MRLPTLARTQSRTERYAQLAVWAAFIFALSSQPTLPGSNVLAWDYLLKKTGHLVVYGVFFKLAYHALAYDIDSAVKRSLLAALMTILYAISDEIHQSLVPGRTPTIKDFLFDMLGMSISWLVIHRYI